MFLFKPHVEGLEGQITSPDIVIDRVFVDSDEKPVSRLTSEIVQTVETGETARAAFALTAVGGGLLVGPAVILSSGVMSIARRAWRWRHVADRLDGVSLNGVPLDATDSPEEWIESLGGRDGALPRGLMAVRPGAEGSTATLHDAFAESQPDPSGRARAAGQRPLDGKRPMPRYSVGPTQREVQHYI